MASLFQAAATLLVIYIVSAIVKQWSFYRRLNETARKHGCQPATRYRNWDPFFGLDAMLLIAIRTLQGKSSEYYRNLRMKNGSTFTMKRLTRSPIIITSHPKNIQAVLATKFDDWGVAPPRRDIGRPFMENGVFTDDGEDWKRARALIRPTFSRNEVADLERFEEYVGRFLELVSRDGETFDLQELARRLVSTAPRSAAMMVLTCK